MGEVAQDPQLVRQTAAFVLSSYSNVKQWSKFVRYGLERVEGGISWVVPDSAKSTLVNASERGIVRADETLAGVLHKVQELSVVRPFKPAANGAEDEKPAQEETAVVTSEPELNGSAEEAAPAGVQARWKSLRGDLTRKAIQRLENGFVSAKAFSSGPLKSHIHVDLIEYATEVLDNAHATAKPHYEKVNEKLAHAVLRVSTSLEAVQSVLQQGKKMCAPAELRQKLNSAIAAARQLSQNGVHYISEHKSQLTLENIKALPKNSVNFIMNAPALFQKLQKMNDDGELQSHQLGGVITQIHSLLHAVGDVFSKYTGNGSKTAADVKPKEGAEEAHAEGEEAQAEADADDDAEVSDEGEEGDGEDGVADDAEDAE